ncbi:hypothetical protein [Pleurocapsa sp. PCC 7319]|uniref:hypothetical protein n=1 Tax=Pleurocapsa sp. PCC 7319 TaxID=118161 RepID=UPI000344A6E0|nr:hypothetical protein [Pleurocapsa sp. PCC 7319]
MLIFQLVHSITNRFLKIGQIKGLFSAIRRNHRPHRLTAQNEALNHRRIDVLTESESPLSAKGWG